MCIINFVSTKSVFFSSYIMCLQDGAVTDVICTISICKQKLQAAQVHRALSMTFKRKPTLPRAWEESVDTSRTNCSLFPAISDRHSGNHWPMKYTLCSPELFAYLPLAHLCAWISTIIFIYSSRTRRHSEVYKIWLMHCGQSPVSFRSSAHQDTKQNKEWIL